MASTTLEAAPRSATELADIIGLVEETLKPSLVEIKDPLSGARALATATARGLSQVPADIFDGYLSKPRQRRGSAQLTTVDSLIAHINRFKDADSVIFADDDRSAPSIRALLNYHPAGATSDPRWGDHRSCYAFPLSDEWKAWTKANGTPMAMQDFAAFLEERVIDVLHLIPGEDSLPEDLQRFVDISGGADSIASPQRLIELSRGLRINENSAVREVVNLSSGEGQVLFQSEHTDEMGLPLRIPSLFLIGIPVSKGGPLYRIAARLRYRKQGGIVFWYDLWRTDRVFDHAFSEACERVSVETELPLLFGTPE